MLSDSNSVRYIHIILVGFISVLNRFNFHLDYIFLHISNLILNCMEAQIIETLKEAGKALKAGEIAELSGIDKKDVDKVIKVLKSENKLYCPKRCFYDIQK